MAVNAPHNPTPPAEWMTAQGDWRSADSIERAPVRVISSTILFNGGREIVIEHAGSQYRMKITRQNKLILNK